jgi:hypothetical protein
MHATFDQILESVSRPEAGRMPEPGGLVRRKHRLSGHARHKDELMDMFFWAIFALLYLLTVPAGI